jgi:hypothetical protein
MNKEFVPYEESLALKQLDFDEPCFRWYDERWGDDLQQDKFNTNKDLFMTDLDCSAPLYQQAFRWFREKYNLLYNINETYEKSSKYIYSIGYGWSDALESYEEAELECLKKLIEIIKNK